MDEATSMVSLVAQVLDLGMTGVLMVGIIVLWLRLRFVQNEYAKYVIKVAEDAEKRAEAIMTDYKHLLSASGYQPGKLSFPSTGEMSPGAGD